MVEVDAAGPGIAGRLPDSPLELAELIDVAVAKLAGSSLGVLSDRQVIACVETVETAWRRAAGVNAALYVEIAGRAAYTLVGHRSVKTFYAQYLRLGTVEAKRRREVAEAIGPLSAVTGEALPPKRGSVAQAVGAGAVSADHVCEIETVLGRVPCATSSEEVDTAVEILVGAAREVAPSDLRPLGQRLLAHLDPDGKLTDDRDRRRMRGIVIGRQDKRLMSKISGYLTPSLRAKLEVVLDNWAKPGMNNPADPDSLRGSFSELGEADREAWADAQCRDGRSAAQRQHDGLEHGLDWILGHQALGRPTRIPAQLVITVEEGDLARRAGVATTATGSMIPVGDLIAVAADAVPWLCVFTSCTREVLAFGRGKRLATMAQRLALFGAYLGCTRPGCTRPFSHTEAHHGLLDFAKGGETNLDELVPACGPDNRNVGDRPGQWETGPITSGPDTGRIGWRLAGSGTAYRVNRVHDPGPIFARPPPLTYRATKPVSPCCASDPTATHAHHEVPATGRHRRVWNAYSSMSSKRRRSWSRVPPEIVTRIGPRWTAGGAAPPSRRSR
ncbi:DUF222 domain-containing protein [Gordonia sp. X0973]|nr:DUF222 domain-containing protein [Gordonia sp. X0973]